VSARSRRARPAFLCAAGAVALAVGLALAYVTRDDPAPVAALSTLGVGTALVLAGIAWIVGLEGQADRLVLPDGLSRLPPPAWWFPVAATGVVDLAAGPAVSGWIGLVGALLVAVATAGAGHALLTSSTGPGRTVVRAARRLRMVLPGDGALVGALEPVGRSGVRVVAVAPDGQWVDVMLGTAERARAAAALGGVELLDQTDPSFSGAFGRGPGAWSPLVGPRRSRGRFDLADD